MATVLCPKCKGFKRLLGLGMLEKDCNHCNKTGRVTAEQQVIAPAIGDANGSQLREDLRSLSDAYTDAQAENNELKAQLAALKTKQKSKSAGKSK